MARILTVITLIAMCDLTFSQSPDIHMERILGFFEYNYPALAPHVMPNDHPYQYDAANHIADGGGMYSGSGGNYVSFGYGATEAVQNVMYNSSGSVGPIMWKNRMIRPFTQILRVSNRNDTSINRFFLTVRGTLSAFVSTITTISYSPVFTMSLPCYVRLGYVTLRFVVENSPQTSCIFIYVGESASTDVQIGVDAGATFPLNNYDVDFDITGSPPGGLVEGYILYFLLGDSSTVEPTFTEISLAFQTLLTTVSDLLCSIVGGGGNSLCTNGFPLVNGTNLALEGCVCIEGWTGNQCNQEIIPETTPSPPGGLQINC